VEIKAELLLRHKRFLDFFDLLCISPISQYLMRITGTEPTNLTGSLLVALPTLLDPNFRRTILFLVKHDPTEGAMGVILNRPTEYRLPDLDDLVPDGLEKVPVFEGGPVEKHQLILARMIVAETATRFEALDREIGNPLANLTQGELRAFVGYAGWTSGQLEREIAEKSWITLPPTPELLTLVASDEEGSVLWRSIMKRLGPMYHLMALAPDDPGLN
jgi:putative transcriptional regulator